MFLAVSGWGHTGCSFEVTGEVGRTIVTKGPRNFFNGQIHIDQQVGDCLYAYLADLIID